MKHNRLMAIKEYRPAPYTSFYPVELFRSDVQIVCAPRCATVNVKKSSLKKSALARTISLSSNDLTFTDLAVLGLDLPYFK